MLNSHNQLETAVEELLKSMFLPSQVNLKQEDIN